MEIEMRWPTKTSLRSKHRRQDPKKEPAISKSLQAREDWYIWQKMLYIKTMALEELNRVELGGTQQIDFVYKNIYLLIIIYYNISLCSIYSYATVNFILKMKTKG